jgi:hypothetical protein
MFLFEYFKDVAEYSGVKFYSDNLNNLGDFNTRDTNETFILSPYRVTPSDFHGPITKAKQLLTNNLSDTVYIVHVRNPIDILVSEYYSFGFMHKVSEKNKVGLEEIRKYVKDHTIDEYCIKRARDTSLKYGELYKLIEKNIDNPNYVFSSYSEMKNDYKAWNKKIASIMNLDQSQKRHLYSKYKEQFLLKPLDNTDVITHKVNRHIRDGSVKQYLEQLTPDTVNTLKQMFSAIISERIRKVVLDLDFL